MAKNDYVSPELELKRFLINESVFTSQPGPPDLDDGDDLDPDNINGMTDGYFAD